MLYLYIIGCSFEICDIFALETNHLQFWVISQETISHVCLTHEQFGGRKGKQGLEGYSRDSGFGQNAVRESGKRLIYWRDSGSHLTAPGKARLVKIWARDAGFIKLSYHALPSHWDTIFFWRPTYILHLLAFVEIRLFKNIFFWEEKRDSGYWWKMCEMLDSHGKGAGMRDEDSPSDPGESVGPPGWEVDQNINQKWLDRNALSRTHFAIAPWGRIICQSQSEWAWTNRSMPAACGENETGGNTF